MKSTYATALSNKKTPQSTPIPGREKEQVKNSAGGYVFEITPFQMLERFLILGSDQPTYYVSAQKMTKDNAENIRVCLKEDGKKTVDMIVAVSEAGRAPKNDPAIFALAVAATPEFGSQETAQYALSKVNKVCRIGTHLFHFAEYLNSMRGWGRSVKNAIGSWYTEKNESQLAYQLAKYQQRDGWSTKDLLNLAHVKTADPVKSALLAWSAVGGLDALKEAAGSWTRTGKKYKLTQTEINTRRTRFEKAYSVLTGTNAPKLIAAYEAAKKATTVSEVVKAIRDGGLTHEMIPTQFKTSPEVWEALLDKMPLTAMIRNLGNMTKIGLLKPLSEASKLIVNRLNDSAYLKKSRVHPLQILLAERQYQLGHGLRGSGEWTSVATINDALEEAFYGAFANVVPTGKAIYIGLDVSGSMSWSCVANTAITSAQAGAAMAMVIARTEKNYAIFGFSDHMKDLKITAKDTLESALKKTSDQNFGRTDCAQPMIHAGQAGIEADAFLTITDNETWAGSIHPSQALKTYRNTRSKPDIRNIVMAVTATEFTIADPKDPYSLDVVGFDASVPALISDFIRGEGAGLTEDTEEQITD